jgi:hypothetical protein
MGFRNELLSKPTGYQGQDIAQTSSTTTTGAWANIFPAYTFAAVAAGTYLVHLDVLTSATVLSAGRATAVFALVVNGTSYGLTGGEIDVISTANYWSASWRTPVPMVAGNNTLQLQWYGPVGTMSMGGNGCRVFTITG